MWLRSIVGLVGLTIAVAFEHLGRARVSRSSQLWRCLYTPDMKDGIRNFRSTLFNSEGSSELVATAAEHLEADFVRTWYLKKFNQRPEVMFYDGDHEVCGIVELLAEVWKAVLVSVRVMEKDQEMEQYRSLTVFPALSAALDIANNDDGTLQAVEAAVESINDLQSSFLMQPNFKRAVCVRVLPAREGRNANADPVLMVEVDTKREYAPTPDFGDLDDFTPSVEDALNNDIDNFPFPTVYDFISEINRPADAGTMAELRFHYKIFDFKYDLKAMAKKKNPQDVVDNINCKLTRLAKWRDVLHQAGEGETDAFTDTLTWSQEVKARYQSLKAVAAVDTRKALDTQYDKRKVFMNIIDQWSERLKRSFKFTFFQSTREPEKFNDVVMNSLWRKDFARTMHLLAKAPFMDFEGPDFQPGMIKPMFADDRVLLWDSNYRVDTALSEMLAWMNYSDKAKMLAQQPTIGHVQQHTYSRGMISERVITDTFKGLSAWLEGSLEEKKQLPIESSAEAYDATQSSHHAAFKSSIATINKLSRKRSMKELSGVKEMYQSAFNSGKEILEWWTTIVRNLDRASEMEAIAQDRSQPWSAIIDDVVTDPGAADATESVSIQAAQEMAEENIKLWNDQYKEVVLFAEEIESQLKWNASSCATIFEEYAANLKEMGALSGETISVGFDIPSDSYMFVAPRYFRGIGADEELSAFGEYTTAIERMIKSPAFLKLSGLAEENARLEVTSLHPLAFTKAGAPDYGRRSPHPALLFKLVR